MDRNRLHEILEKRKSIHDEWDAGLEECWRQMRLILSEDIEGTIQYLRKDCTFEEFTWISEVFEDVARETKSEEFVRCIEELIDTKFLDQKERNKVISILPFIRESVQL